MEEIKDQRSKIKDTNQKYKNIFSYLVCIFNFCFLIFYFSVSCGSGAVVEQVQNPPATNPEDKTSLNLTPQENVFVIASNFTDPVGSVATVGLVAPHPIVKARAITDSSDVIIKSFDGKLFVINRGSASIQVINPDTFKILSDYSVGVGTNPQDLVVANGKAFITRLDSQLGGANKDDLWVVDPTSGKLLTSTDLKPFADDDGDRLARAGQMALVGDSLYVLIQDLSKSFKATTNGKVAVVDTKTNTPAATAIALGGRNPTDIAYQGTLNRLFITDSGDFDTKTSYGGMEIIDVATNKTFGILIDDAGFDGYVSLVRFLSDRLGVITVNATVVATFDPKNLSVLTKNLYTSPGGFLGDLLIDKNGLLWVPERNPKNAGVLLLDPANGATLAGPLGVGALPTSLTLIH